MKLIYCFPVKLCRYIAYLVFAYLLLFAWRPARGQTTVSRLQGRILSFESGEALVGASILLKGSTTGATTDKDGHFTLPVSDTKEIALVVSFIGYRSLDTLIRLPLTSALILSLHQEPSFLQEVAITGYQQIPRERSTGSFVNVGQQLLNRKVSTNLLDRLDGITSGVLFKAEQQKATSANPLGRNLGIRIRGENTLGDITQVSRDPLIVVDNFPFEGNLDNINPNDVESVSILRDAAAASIWGARAGNGVIVITTKKGSKNAPMTVELNSNVSISSKPDLYADRNYLPSADYIQAEKILFDAGYFNADLADNISQSPLSPVIELLEQQKNGLISDAQTDAQLSELGRQDLRSQYLRHVYRRAVNQQYAASIKGGNQQASYALSAGYDHNLSDQIGNDYSRLTLNSKTTYSLAKGLDLTTALNYSNNLTTTNNYQNNFGYLPVGGKYGNLYPYARLAAEDGSPLAVVRDYRKGYTESAETRGLLDWQYRPLQETATADNSTRINSLLLRGGLQYRISPSLSAEVIYQNESQRIHSFDNRSQDSYYARDLINRFTLQNSDGSLTYQVPKGGILMQNNTFWQSQNLRTQLNLDRKFGNSHQLTALAGAEARRLQTKGQIRTSYGYNDDLGVSVNNLDFKSPLTVNPSGTAQIPAPAGEIYTYDSRFLSYYANGAYTYLNKYTLSVSARKDGANIFGAKTNNRFSPLWSAGIAWDISKSNFYKISWMPYMKLRSSYGYSGNPYQGTAYVKGVYSTSSYTGAQTIQNLTAPNPELRWEKVGTLNIGLDFASKRNMVNGSIEYYIKKGSDLIERQQLAPSVGFSQFFTNGAATATHGLDLTLNGEVTIGQLRWQPVILLSLIKDKIERFSVRQSAASIQNPDGRPGIIGKPLYGIYSYRWAGLDPATGDPQGYLNGEISADYLGIINNFNADSLVFHGSAVPKIFGSLRNDFSFKGFSISINLTYKLGYFFRRQSVSPNYADVLAGYAHQDYQRRWQKPGDESLTDIPSFVYPSNTARSTFYRFSQATVERADHLRLQDIRLSYDLPAFKKGAGDAQIYLYAANLGILWRANKYGIDPDVAPVAVTTDHNLPRAFSIAMGIKVKL